MLIKFKMGCFLGRKEWTKYGRQAETPGESEGETTPRKAQSQAGRFIHARKARLTFK